ncbi:hypothetical protein [Glycomyces sp. NPDC021274]|uniref:hypothetical protein n=1 Tax=Glycomyces sp. NPDC021274 TaxID=3155120 RepID=UPI0033E932D3
MSEDIEALLRSGLAERAHAVPDFDDPGLADLAIAGAGRLRRRRRAAAAASGAGLLVLGAAVVWNPVIGLHDDGKGDMSAADTSTVEVQNELGMEFFVEDADGGYSVLTEDGGSLPFDAEEPYQYVYRLTTQYMLESEANVWTLGLDGDSLTSAEKPSPETTTKVNSAGDRYALVTPNEDYSEEEYSLVDVSLHAATEAVEFTTSYDIALEDWNDSTAVFTADLHPTTGGEPSTPYLNSEFNYGLETVSAAGFEAAVLVDLTDPSNVCISDLDAAGTADEREQCGPLADDEIQESLSAAAGEEGAEDAAAIAEGVVAKHQPDTMSAADVEVDMGEFQERYEKATEYWTDPAGRWVVWANRGDETWLLIDMTGDEPVVSELDPPDGALMPVVSYT